MASNKPIRKSLETFAEPREWAFIIDPLAVIFVYFVLDR
jgi:hypothetical protein